VLALAPEGTRSKVKQWKSGFYSIAIQAGVPVVPVALDYGSRTVEIFDAFWPTGQLEQDLAQLQGLYKNVTPRHPELF
jgi:1-acyl-sn-glycerol-3-phosphate acyltransferase